MSQLAHVDDSVEVGSLNGRACRLKKREIEILRYVANGNTYVQTGKTLGINAQTVKNYMTELMRKLGANNKAHATALALRYGILSLNEIAPSQAIKQPNGAKEQAE